MFRLLSAAFAVALVGGLGFADDKKPAEKKPDLKLGGVWVKQVEGAELTFDFTTKDQLKVTVSAGEAALIINTKLTADKDGKITAKASKIETKGEFPFQPREDYEFSFKIKVDGMTASVSDFTSNENEEQGKQVVEGDYEKKGDK